MTFTLVDAVPNGCGWEGTWSGPLNYVIVLVARDCFVPQEKAFPKAYNKVFINQACSVKTPAYWPCSFCASLGPSTRRKIINLANIQPFWHHAWQVSNFILAHSATRLVSIGALGNKDMYNL